MIFRVKIKIYNYKTFKNLQAIEKNIYNMFSHFM